jgi:ATP-dependent Clp protease protease subunit
MSALFKLPADSGALEVFSEIETRCLALSNAERPSDGKEPAIPKDEAERIKAWLAKNQPALAAKASGEDLEIAILGVIGGWWEGINAREVRRILEQNKNAKTIRVLLDTPGGDYFDGVAIMNMLKRHSASVTIEVLGEATSAGSVIAMGGDRIEMHTGTMMMIHQAWTIALGNADELRNAADMLGKIDDSLVAVYEARTGKAKNELMKLVRATTWMTASDAIEKGFADAEIGAKKGTDAGKTKAARADGDRAERAAHARALAQSSELVAGSPELTPEPLRVSNTTAAVLALETPASSPPEPAPQQPGPKPEPPPAAKAPEATPSPAGPESTTPNSGERNSSMTEQNNPTPPVATPTVAHAMGLPAGATEQDMLARASALRGLELGIMTLAGVQVSSEALGAVRGMKAKADAHDAMAAELAQVKAERDQQNFDALILKGNSAPKKLNDSTTKFYQDKFAAAVKEGRGADIVNDLKGFIDAAPTIASSSTVVVREPKLNAQGATTWNGKTYAELKPAERARLASQDPELFAAMRRDNEQSAN